MTALPPFRLTSWLTSGKVMSQLLWPEVQLELSPPCWLLYFPCHLSMRLVGCDPWKPSALFFLEPLCLMEHPELRTPGQLKHCGALHFLSLTVCWACLSCPASVIESHGPSMAQVGRRQRLWGSKWLSYLGMTIILNLYEHVLLLVKWKNMGIVGRASSTVPFSLWVCTLTYQEHIKWDWRTSPTGVGVGPVPGSGSFLKNPHFIWRDFSLEAIFSGPFQGGATTPINQSVSQSVNLMNKQKEEERKDWFRGA